jgi:formylglycine-generating enzyme required for sulfatase activity
MSHDKKPYTVFISSTFIDNKPRRKLAEDAILRAGVIPVGMERFTALAHPVAAECERPQHEVAIRPFLLGRYPVTNEEYARFLEAHPKSPEPKYWADRRYNQARQPVVGVEWKEAKRFCAWAGGRLPTEAEWEYACRAGTTTAFHWGDDEGQAAEFAWYGENSGGATHPEGEKRPNPWGLHDITGNVWEWIADVWH